MNLNPPGREQTVQTIQSEYSHVWELYDTEAGTGPALYRHPKRQKHLFWPSQGPTVTKLFCAVVNETLLLL